MTECASLCTYVCVHVCMWDMLKVSLQQSQTSCAIRIYLAHPPHLIYNPEKWGFFNSPRWVPIPIKNQQNLIGIEVEGEDRRKESGDQRKREKEDEEGGKETCPNPQFKQLHPKKAFFVHPSREARKEEAEHIWGNHFEEERSSDSDSIIFPTSCEDIHFSQESEEAPLIFGSSLLLSLSRFAKTIYSSMPHWFRLP